MKELTKRLEAFIDDEVSRRVKEIKGSVENYKDFTEEFIRTLDQFEHNGRELLRDCKSDELKFSEAEAEGFLRAVITIRNEFKEELKHINDV